jgi:integrase/recombinase XerC
VLDPAEARALLASIDVSTPRERTLIALMVYSFARVGAALGMKVEDACAQSHQLWLRLHEKGGKAPKMPCHDNLEKYLTAGIDGCVGRRQSLQ